MQHNFWKIAVTSNHDREYWIGNQQILQKFVVLILFILQGIIKMLKLGMYFCKRGTILSSSFSKVMTEYRFILLSKFFHFANNTGYNEVMP